MDVDRARYVRGDHLLLYQLVSIESVKDKYPYSYLRCQKKPSTRRAPYNEGADHATADVSTEARDEWCL
jgi:hypothetical protein